MHSDPIRTQVYVKLLAALLVVFTISAGRALPLPSPPAPRFVTVPNNMPVLAIWDNSNDPGRVEPSGLQQTVASDTTLISKSAGATQVAPDGTLHYSIALTNATNITQTFRVTDTLPLGLTYITNTATGGFVYNAASTSLTATHLLKAFDGDVVTATGAPTYTEILTATGAANICQNYFPQCDDNAITLGGVPFRYLGVDYTTITLDSNGFVMPGSANPGPAYQNQNMPDATGPNNVIAPFWDELDLHGKDGDVFGGGDWLYAVLQDSGSKADCLVVEWHDAQKEDVSGTAYSFQVWVQLQTEHITFAFANPAFVGDTSSATVGFENSDGTLGHSYLYNGVGQMPSPGTELQINAVYDTAQLGFDVRAQHNLHGCSTITNLANLSGAGGALDSAAATVNVFGPCEFLPLINR
jgi:uncharacterized repeat protein (TIGR01451 family)